MYRALKSQPPTIGPVEGSNGLAYTEKEMAEIFATSLENQFQPHSSPANPTYNNYISTYVESFLNSPTTGSIDFTTPEEVIKIVDKKKCMPKKPQVSTPFQTRP